MSLTKIDNDQLKDLTITNEKIASNADIRQAKILNLVSDLSTINAALADKVDLSGGIMTGALVLSSDPTNNLEAATKQYTDQKVDKAGSTMTGFLTLNADPTSGLHAATKGYVDNTSVLLNGSTMSGPLILSENPTVGLQAATKQYVDNQIIAQGITLDTTGFIVGSVFKYIDDTTFLVAGGIYSSDDNTTEINTDATVLSLTTSGLGGLDTGVIGNNNWYHVWGIKDTTANTTNIIFSLSNTTPTLASNFDKKRRIGSFHTNGLGNMDYFTQTISGSTKTTHISPISIVGASNTFNAYSSVLPLSSNSALIDIAIDQSSTAPQPVVVSEIMELVTPKLLTRKSSYGLSSTGEFWVNLNNGQFYITGAIATSPTHIPIVNIVGYQEDLQV